MTRCSVFYPGYFCANPTKRYKNAIEPRPEMKKSCSPAPNTTKTTMQPLRRKLVQNKKIVPHPARRIVLAKGWFWRGPVQPCTKVQCLHILIQKEWLPFGSWAEALPLNPGHNKANTSPGWYSGPGWERPTG